MPRRSTISETITPASEPLLSPLESFAIAKAISERQLKELRPRLDVADGQAVDFTVRIHGALNVASDASATSLEKPPADAVLAAVLGAMAPRALPLVRLHVRRLFSAWTAGEELPALDPKHSDAADDLLTVVSRSVTKSKRGNVSASLAVERLGNRAQGTGHRAKTVKRKAAA